MHHNAAEIFAAPQEYNGFNLCLADLVSGEIAYLTNRGKAAAGTGPLKLEHQLYGLSNGVLHDLWPKVLGLWMSPLPVSDAVL